MRDDLNPIIFLSFTRGLILHPFAGLGELLPQQYKDSFVVVLERYSNISEASVDVLITRNYLFESPEKDYLRGLDRISRMLPSGQSVSVALRKKSDGPANMLYVLDISIDPEGKLPWPELKQRC